jgi:hypothetical protein
LSPARIPQSAHGFATEFAQAQLTPLLRRALESIAIRSDSGMLAGQATHPIRPQNRAFRRLARPRKRHYTFAGRRFDHVTAVGVRHGAIASLKR